MFLPVGIPLAWSLRVSSLSGMALTLARALGILQLQGWCVSALYVQHRFGFHSCMWYKLGALICYEQFSSLSTMVQADINFLLILGTSKVFSSGMLDLFKRPRLYLLHL